jgi:hypothetical protein
MQPRFPRAAALAALLLAVGCNDSTGGRPVPASLQFADPAPVVEVGAEARLGVTVLDDRGRPIADAPLRFTSSHPSWWRWTRSRGG